MKKIYRLVAGNPANVETEVNALLQDEDKTNFVSAGLGFQSGYVFQGLFYDLVETKLPEPEKTEEPKKKTRTRRTSKAKTKDTT